MQIAKALFQMEAKYIMKGNKLPIKKSYKWRCLRQTSTASSSGSQKSE